MMKFREVIRFLFYQVIAVGILFVLVEGLSSITLIFYNIWQNSRQFAERIHTEYDETLGWINSPNLYIKNMYGTGIYLRTNKQRFRNNHEITRQVPTNKLRIICSGDSFTLGYGVDNDHTWCHQLTLIDPNIESVNMGQGGYGIDQAYLWYKRDGINLDHNIHILSFITKDFYRMAVDTLNSYGKPVLYLKDDNLVTRNVPVPKSSFINNWLNKNINTLKNLNSIRLFNNIFARRSTSHTSQIENKLKDGDSQIRKILLKIFQDLYKINKSKNSIFILAYLPIQKDYFDTSSDEWRQYIQIQAKKYNIVFIDLISEFRKVEFDIVDRMFIKEYQSNYRWGHGHYNEEGNLYIAKVLYDKLRAIPELSDKWK